MIRRQYVSEDIRHREEQERLLHKKPRNSITLQIQSQGWTHQVNARQLLLELRYALRWLTEQLRGYLLLSLKCHFFSSFKSTSFFKGCRTLACSLLGLFVGETAVGFNRGIDTREESRIQRSKRYVEVCGNGFATWIVSRLVEVTTM